MKYNKGDWVLVGNGKVSHLLGQGYDGLCPICTPTQHSAGNVYSAHVEQEDMRSPNGAEKCKRCLVKAAKYRN